MLGVPVHPRPSKPIVSIPSRRPWKVSMQRTRKMESIEAELRRSMADWEDRLRRIRVDRRHEAAPLDKDSGDRAIERENDEALDELDQVGRRELEAIEHALARIADGTYGTCTGCGDAIPIARLEASPSSETCIDCAR